jgi:hypothetical protein
MGRDEVPSLLNRVFTSAGREKQEHLDKIRQLRRGDIVGGEIEVNVRSDSGNYVLKFNLRRELSYLQQQEDDMHPMNFNNPMDGSRIDPSHMHMPRPVDYPVVPQPFQGGSSLAQLDETGVYYPEGFFPPQGTSVVPPLNNGYTPAQFSPPPCPTSFV